ANWEYNDQGSLLLSNNADGNIINASGSRNLVTVGVRPVYWITDGIAIQGAASWAYEDNVRNNFGTNAFGRSGQYGIFTIAPTIKPKGGFFTRPEIRVFATYAIWSNSLKGSTIANGGPPYTSR